jgi:hypothetical protein
MRYLALAIFFMAAGQAQAAPLAPVTGGALDGIPMAQAMATMNLLGEWQLASGGLIRLEQVETRNGGECGVSDRDDADTCSRFTLLVSANGETSVPQDFVLFRLPETLGWKVPDDAKLENSFGKFSISLSACEMKKTASGTGWEGTSYVLRINEELKNGPDGFGHYVFGADLEKTPGSRPDCSS